MTIAQKVLLLGLLLFTGVLLAQDVPPPDPNKGGVPGFPVPIDGFVWLGGLVALAYGAIKKYNNPK